MTLVIEKESPPLEVGGDGAVRVVGTRVTLDTLLSAFKGGATAEEIVRRYPTVPRPDAYAVIGYYLRHTEAVEAYLREREREAAALRREAEARLNPLGIRERLLARRAAGHSGGHSGQPGGTGGGGEPG